MKDKNLNTEETDNSDLGAVSGSYDTPNCEKCGNHTALVTGTFFYSADDEPFKNGVQEKVVINDECWVGGYVCLSCKNVQGLWHE